MGGMAKGVDIHSMSNQILDILGALTRVTWAERFEDELRENNGKVYTALDQTQAKLFRQWVGQTK